jgi:hypothetical protein
VNAAVTPSLSSYARTKVASSFTISVPKSSASPALSSDLGLRRMARASCGEKLPMLEPMYIASVVPLNRCSFGGFDVDAR